VADKRCDNGHFIDESWDICPYCPQDMSEPEIPVVRPHSIELRASPAAAAVAQAPPAAARAGGGAVPLERPQRATAPGAPPAAPPMERTVAASKIDVKGMSAPKRYVVGWLVALDGGTRGESYPIRMGRNVIGRDNRSDIVINDDQASSHHADLVFRPEERRFILMDHNSTNGTYVNESEIEPRKDLTAKDVVRIGSHRFLFAPLCHEGFHWDDEGLLK
jgi:hypothetical protein